MLSVLYFDPDTKELVARDDITLGGLGLSSAEIQRTQIQGTGEVDGTVQETGPPSDQEEPVPPASPGSPAPAPTPAPTRTESP
ncbi:MAG: hypothetical protein GWN07_29050 [Actinobacteria bacterium]|nr:hypothetical protein [Actinomycetota bacterium]NIU69442.1 hypothetical protein [Actinomycetota bacterium]NIW31307.1 hypothetical protein [Actinomycetota bacterium]NIX23654.1 hypothetical protein [Actinomycetota bacterium]